MFDEEVGRIRLDESGWKGRWGTYNIFYITYIFYSDAPYYYCLGSFLLTMVAWCTCRPVCVICAYIVV